MSSRSKRICHFEFRFGKVGKWLDKPLRFRCSESLQILHLKRFVVRASTKDNRLVSCNGSRFRIEFVAVKPRRCGFLFRWNRRMLERVSCINQRSQCRDKLANCIQLMI